MKKAFLMLFVSALASQAYAQQTPDGVRRSSSPSGIRIQGETVVRTQASNDNAPSDGGIGAAKQSRQAVRGNVKIQGNTRIDAHGHEVNAVAVGRDNQAGNAVGAIGGK